MKHLGKLLIAGSALLAPAAAHADVILSANTLSGGNVAAYNTTSGNIAVCYATCTVVGNLGVATANAHIAASPGVGLFFVTDKSTGRTARCLLTGAAWNCVVVATTIP